MTPFNYCDERFADLQLLRYRLEGFEQLTLKQKQLVYYLAKATLYGRDITFDQFGRYNLKLRRMLEVVYTDWRIPHDTADFKALTVYLKRLWFSNGIYHHYGCEKFVPGFSEGFLRSALHVVEPTRLPLAEGQTVDGLCDELFPVIFRPDVLPKRVNKADGSDLVITSACNFYQGVTQEEAEKFYAGKKAAGPKEEAPSYGLNTTLVKAADGRLHEEVWSTEGRYANALRHIVYWLELAAEVAENDKQKKTIELLVKYYKTGDLTVFDEYLSLIHI